MDINHKYHQDDMDIIRAGLRGEKTDKEVYLQLLENQERLKRKIWLTKLMIRAGKVVFYISVIAFLLLLIR
jgi:hypothetical protein